MPAPLAIAAVALIAAGAVGGAYSAFKQGESQQNYYNFLADQSKLKAQLTRKAAQEQIGYIQDEASRAGHELKVQVNQIEAQQKTAMIAQGMSLNSVTAEDIIKDNVSKMQLDEMAIRYNAELKSYQTERAGIMQAMDLYSQGMTQALSGQMAMSTGKQNAYSSLIGGAAQATVAYGSLNRGGSNSTTQRQGPSQQGYGGTNSYGAQSGYKY